MRALFGSLCLAVVLVMPLAASAEEPTAGQVAEATELLETMHMDVAMSKAIDTMLDSQMKSNPKLLPFEATMRDFMTKYLSWDAVKPDLVKVYAEAFTEADLKKMVKFYKTGTGQKAIALMPELMQKGAELGRAKVVEHQGELETLIAARAAELAAQPPPE